MADMPDMTEMTNARDSGWTTLEADAFRFRYKFRTNANDRGPTLEVYGLLDDGEWKEVLKFDCFEHGPHWHRCYPGRADDVFNQEPAGFDAVIAFASTQLSGEGLPTMLREQGYAALATPERIAAAQAAVPGVIAAMQQAVAEHAVAS